MYSFHGDQKAWLHNHKGKCTVAERVDVHVMRLDIQ